MANITTETLSRFFPRHCLKQCRESLNQSKDRANKKSDMIFHLFSLRGAASAAILSRRNMPLTASALATLIIVAPRKAESVASRILPQTYSPLKRKHCFNQYRFLSKKLMLWKNKSMLGSTSQFLREEKLPKI